MKKILAFLFLIAVESYAQVPVAYEYIIFSSTTKQFSLSTETFKIGRLDNVGGHWEFSTKIYSNLDCGISTNYFILWLTTTTQAMNTVLNNTNVKKCYMRTRRRSIWGDAQGRHDVFEQLAPYPSNLYEIHKTSSW